MSDTEQPPVEHQEAKITKPKSPGRVAAGKKLAEMNRKNKAKKDQKEEDTSSSWDINPGYVIGLVGLVIGAGSLYLQWKGQKKPAPQPTPPTPANSPTPQRKKIPDME